MRLIPLNQATCAGWAQVLPEEIFVDLMRGNRQVHAVGVTFQERPCGAACWEEQDMAWVLRSIYVLPQYRRLGLGRELVTYVAGQLLTEEGRHLTVLYECEAGRDHLTLGAFFRACGFRMEIMELPLGVTDLETVQTALQERSAYKNLAAFRSLEELTTREKHIVNEWLLDMTGDRLSRYMGSHAAGYVAMRSGELYGAIFYSMYRNGARLDYCWVDREHKQLLLPLLACATEDLGSQCAGNPGAKADYKIEMILSTEQAMQVFTRLLDSDIEQTILCIGELEEENGYV